MFVSVFMDNYGDGVEKAVKMCNDVFLGTYIHDVDCETVFFDVDNQTQTKTVNAKGQELVDFWDAYKEFYKDLQDMWKLSLVVAARKVMEIRGELLFSVNEKAG